MGNKYKFMINGCVIAEGMSLEWSVIFVKAVFQEIPNDASMEVTIMEHEKTKGCCHDR